MIAMTDIPLVIAVLGSVVAGAWDLKTTEVPDEIPALMISLGLFVHFLSTGMTGDFYPLAVSLSAGTILLIAGLLMYSKGQWGGADAWILAAIGYLIPLYSGRIFIIDYLLNFLVVSAVYMIVYAVIIGARNPQIFSYFSKELKAKWKIVAGIPLLYAVFSLFMLFYVSSSAVNVMPLLYILILVTLLTLFWVYGKVIEKYAFRKKIPASRLKVGDILEEMLWRGITEEEIKTIRKKKKFVVIKEGIRFVPVFPITLLVTLMFGNILFLLVL